MQAFAEVYTQLTLTNSGYIAGDGVGIVTVRGKPAERSIWLLDAQTMSVEQITISLNNGHYLFIGLDPLKEYLVMVRDYKKEFESFAWDYVKPADDLTIAEQQALWQSWQTN
ncbi:hypothetical protein ACTXNA_07180 [Psychrobacter celer]|uniref:hypothetical protein n=1 Tax=Psychrobacter celer TaxID=306572 RepID=UPI003FD4F2BB